VDYWMGREFPASPGSNLANHAVNGPMTDNNGPGARRSVLLDVSALGTFSTGSLLIDAKSSAADGPTAAPVTPAAQRTVSLGGYGVEF
jgi:hypothetical protein